MPFGGDHVQRVFQRADDGGQVLPRGLLRPEDAPEAQLLCAVLQKTMTAEPGDRVRFTLLADKCLCFRSQQET